MSVVYSAGDAREWLDYAASWACFYCGVDVEPPCVYWHGETLVVFHGECAARLGAHLIADSREAQLASDPGPHWRRRVLAAARHRLRVEEASAA